MEAFELEQEPLFGSQHHLGGGDGGGLVGGLITKYRLFSGGQGRRSSFSDDNSERSGSSTDGPIHQILNSPIFQKSMLGLIALAVIIHLSTGVGSSESNNDVSLSAAQDSTEIIASHGGSHVPPHPGMEEESKAHSGNHGKANQEEDENDNDSSTTATGVQGTTLKVPPAHSFTLGGKNNKNHNTDKEEDAEAAAAAANLEIEIMEDAIDHMGNWDLSVDNFANFQGHYLHDPLLSPFASSHYEATEDELTKRQEEFVKKVQSIKQQFGEWSNPHSANQQDYDYNLNSQIQFMKHAFRDVDFDHMDSIIMPGQDDDGADGQLNCWQRDAEYIGDFLNQAQALLEATKEAIMMEYGRKDPKDAEKFPFDVIIGDYEVLNGTAVHQDSTLDSLEPLEGIAYLPQASWDGLIRKLLHAIITEDHFYVVVAGRAPDTYDANNFAKTQVMQFNYIMEPIFHKLGMTLISRNMGMDASVAVGALGGADIFGEVDILWHVQDHADADDNATAAEQHGEFDLLHRQMVLSGERVPLILSSNTDELTLSSKGKAWVGNLQPGNDICKGQAPMPACQNLECEQQKDCSKLHNSVCWEVRHDWNPDEQRDEVGFTTTSSETIPPPRQRKHQLEGRKLTLLVLHALSAALDLWRHELDKNKDNKNNGNLPLDPSFWHVGDAYTEIRESIMTSSIPDDQEVQGFSASCDLLMKDLDPRVCHVPMHAFTEWTPRVNPEELSLLANVNNLVDLGGIDHGDDDDDPEPYMGPDIVPLVWRIPTDQIDVHMVAIATNTSEYLDVAEIFVAGEDEEDDDWINDDDNVRKRWRRRRRQRKLSSDWDAVGGWQGKQQRQVHSAYTEKRNRDRNTNSQNKKQSTGSVRSSSSSSSSSRRRATEISEGSGWRLEDAPIGFCDGSAQSRCNRTKYNECLLANHNFYKGSIVGSAANGWLTLQIHGVRHGIVLARIEFEDDDGQQQLPDDLVFEYALNGEVQSIQKDDLQGFGQTIVEGLTVYPLLLEKDTDLMRSADEMKYDVAIRIQSDDSDYKIRLSHIYFA